MLNARDSTKSKEEKEDPGRRSSSFERKSGDAGNDTVGDVTTSVPSTTTSHSSKVQASYFLNVVAMAMVLKYV